MYNCNTDSLGLILGVEVFFLRVTVQEHCEEFSPILDIQQPTLHLCQYCLEMSNSDIFITSYQRKIIAIVKSVIVSDSVQ